jgi:hypothetical protein
VEKIEVDITSYDVETTAADGHTTITENGAFLIPVVWHNRPLIFFPQFLRKTAPRPTPAGTFKNLGETGKAGDQKPLNYWEVKLAWSECRNGKWTQKQLSPGAVYEANPSTDLPPVSSYQFVPRITDEEIVIDVYRPGATLRAFRFSGSQLQVIDSRVTSPGIAGTDFHYLNTSEFFWNFIRCRQLTLPDRRQTTISMMPPPRSPSSPPPTSASAVSPVRA